MEINFCPFSFARNSLALWSNYCKKKICFVVVLSFGMRLPKLLVVLNVFTLNSVACTHIYITKAFIAAVFFLYFPIENVTWKIHQIFSGLFRKKNEENTFSMFFFISHSRTISVSTYNRASCSTQDFMVKCFGNVR